MSLGMSLVVSPIVDKLIEAIGIKRVVALNLRLQLGGDITTLPEYQKIMKIAQPLFTENGKMHEETREAFSKVVASRL